MTERNDAVRVLCLGDVVGRPGRVALKCCCQAFRDERRIDLIIANGENAAGGVGIDGKTAGELKAAGVDVITLGDHAWQRRDFRDYLKKHSFCIRPANYPEGAPGEGWVIVGEQKIGVINLIGRVFMSSVVDCPFRAADRLLEGPLSECSVVICDFHAEATSEKQAMARYLDGRVSLVVGTHTHVQTADERVLPGGTGCISDLGMCGSVNGVIGMDTEAALDRFLTGLPSSYKCAKGRAVLHGVVCEIDVASGKARNIERVQLHADTDDGE